MFIPFSHVSFFTRSHGQEKSLSYYDLLYDFRSSTLRTHPHLHFPLFPLSHHRPYTPRLCRPTTDLLGEGCHPVAMCGHPEDPDCTSEDSRHSRPVIVFSSLRLRCTMILYTSTTVDLYSSLTGHYPFPFSPGSLRPFLCSHPSSLPLLTRLPRHQVTVHLSEIADPDIAEVTRLASLLPTSSTPSSLSPPSRDLHVTGLSYRPR